MDVDSPPKRWPGWVGFACRLILGGALLAAGAMKVFDPEQSVRAVLAYEFPLPPTVTTVVGYGLPVVEIVLGLMILGGVLTRWTAAVGGLAMVVYIAAIMSAWARGLSIDCGCFTPGGVLLDVSQKTAYVQDIVRDLGLLVCAVWLVARPVTRWSLDGWLNAPVVKESHGQV
ncbi:MAG: DoxX family protein [Propionibacteriaceae bacterium]|nr:DoxX family protein [Propionibacteriaceae bacterium]